MLNARILRQMQSRLDKLQEELASLRVEAIAGGGAVKVVATGQQRLLSVEVAPSAVDPQDVEMLQDLILVAVNDALGQARDLAARRMAGVAGNLPIPGLR